MLTFENFSGINNALEPERLSKGALSVATNVDIDTTGQIRLRNGRSRVSEDSHANLFQADGFMLATVGGNGDLTAINGAVRTVIYPSLGNDRVWYASLPDGRVAFSNGLIAGLTDGATRTTWGVQAPDGVGALAEIAGNLFPGEYRYRITYVRLSDGREGAPAYSLPADLTEGGIFLSGLPALAGHKINVYLTSHNDDIGYLAGSTTNAIFSFTGANDTLVQPCKTDFLSPAPVGRLVAMWGNRALVAVGNVLFASRPNQPEHFDLRQDYKQMTATITAVLPVDNGIFVGTETELAFLAGSAFDSLVYRRATLGAVVIGSGVLLPGEHIARGDGFGSGEAAMCIANGRITACFGDGAAVAMTEGRYHTDVSEVFATFRLRDGLPQYVAIPK